MAHKVLPGPLVLLGHRDHLDHKDKLVAAVVKEELDPLDLKEVRDH